MREIERLKNLKDPDTKIRSRTQEKASTIEQEDQRAVSPDPGGSSGGSVRDTPKPSQGDSLEACLNRIPSDVSAGQRILAEQTCRRDAINQGSNVGLQTVDEKVEDMIDDCVREKVTLNATRRQIEKANLACIDEILLPSSDFEMNPQ